MSNHRQPPSNPCGNSCTAKCEDGKCVDPCPNGCPPCHSCGDNGCAPDFDSSKCEICDSKTCQVVSSCKEADCEECQNGRCRSKCDSLQCEECKDGSCVAKKETCKECKNGRLVDKCPSALCQTCNDDKCESLCDSKSCEVCQSGKCLSSCYNMLCQSCVDGVCKSYCGGPGDLCRYCDGGVCRSVSYDQKKCKTCTPDKGIYSLCDSKKGESCCQGTCCDICSECKNGKCVSKADPMYCETCDPETGEVSSCDSSKCEYCENSGTHVAACKSFCNMPFRGRTTTCEKCSDGTCVSACKKETCERCLADTFDSNGQVTSYACKQTCTGDCAQCDNGVCRPTACAPCERCENVNFDYYCSSICDTCEDCVTPAKGSPSCKNTAKEECLNSTKTGCGCVERREPGSQCSTYEPVCQDPTWTPQCVGGAPASPGMTNCTTCTIDPAVPNRNPPCRQIDNCSECQAGECVDIPLKGLELCDPYCPLDQYTPSPNCCNECILEALVNATDGKNCHYEYYSEDSIGPGDPPSCRRRNYRQEVCDEIVCTDMPYDCKKDEVTVPGLAELINTTDCSCEINPCCSTDPETGEDVITKSICCEASEEYDAKCCNPPTVADYLCCQDPEHACCSDPNSPECECDGVIDFLSSPCCMYQDNEAAFNCCENNTSQICCEGTDSYDADCCADNECCSTSDNYYPKCCSKTENFSQACCDDENCCNGGNECCESSDNYNPKCCRTSDSWDPICCDDPSSPCCKGDKCYRYDNGGCRKVSDPCCGITCEPDVNGCARSCFEGLCIQDDPCCGEADPACCRLSSDGTQPPCPSDPDSGCSYQCIDGECIPLRDPCCADSEGYDPSCCPTDPSYDPCCLLNCGNDEDGCATSCERTGRFTAECVKDDLCCGFDCPKNSDPGCSMRCVTINNTPFCDYVDAVCCPSHADYDEACCEQGPCCADNFDATCCPDSDTYDQVCCDDPDDPCCSSNDNDICCPTSPSYDKACCEDPAGPCCTTAQDFDASCCPDDPSYNADCCPPNDKCCVPDCGTDGDGCTTSCINKMCVKDDRCCAVDCEAVDGCTKSCVDGICIYDDACCEKQGTCCVEDDPVCCQIEKNGGCPADGNCSQSCKNGSCQKDDPCCGNDCGECDTCVPLSAPFTGFKCEHNCNTSGTGCAERCLIIDRFNAYCAKFDPCCEIDCPTLSDGCARRCEMGVCVQEDSCCGDNAPNCCRNPGDGCCQVESQYKLSNLPWPPKDANGCQLNCVNRGNTGLVVFVKEDPCCGPE